MYQLEERILFDGAAAVDLAVAQQEQQAQETQAQAQTQPQTQPDSATTSADQNHTQAPNETAPALPADTASAVPTTDAAATDTTAASLSAPIDASNPGQPANTHVNVLVVSDSIENADELFKSANSDTIIVHYNEKTTTGAELLKEITDALHGEKADSIGFVTDKAHDGALKIFSDGDTSEKTITTETQQKFWNGVEGLLAEKGKVNIFASDLASTETGRHLVDSIANITDHQVAASTDVTGDTDAGGNWELEYVSKGTGSVDLIEEYFNRESIQSFDHRIEKPTEIAFIDSSVRDIDTILKGIGDQAEIVYLNKDHAFEQITSYLQGRTDVDAVHLISDGTSGEFYLGNETVNSDFIASHQAELAVWGKAMAADGDIHIYGCDLAKDQVGKDLTNQISIVTGADVAASIDRTGVAGNWNLEFTTGEIQTAGFVIGDYIYNLKTIKVTRLDDYLVTNPDSVLQTNLTLREALLIADSGDNIEFANYTILHSATSTTPDPQADWVKNGGPLYISTDVTNPYFLGIYHFEIIAGVNTKVGGLVDTLVINKNITIDGNIHTDSWTEGTVVHLPTNDSVILDAGHFTGKTFRGIYVDSQATTDPTTGAIAGVVLKNMVVQNGLSLSTDNVPAAGKGGGIYVSGVSYLNFQWTMSADKNFQSHTLRDASVEYCQATYGGGIYNAGTLIFSGDAFHNTADDGAGTGFGGGIYNAGLLQTYETVGNSTTVIQGSVSNNTAADHGGGIFNAGTMDLRGAGANGEFSVDNNTSTSGSGGGIYSNTGNVSLTYVSLDTNSALAGNGGGVYIFANYEQSTPMHFLRTDVTGNKAVDGAGIYLTNANSSTVSNVFELEWSDIDNNIATGNGGGIYLYNNAGNILIATSITPNTSYNVQSEIMDNSAFKGAGVYIENCANVTIDFNIMQNNIATADGGAIYVKDSGNITLTDMEIASNRAQRGGGIYYTNATPGSLNVQRSNISKNTATLFGGGIYQANGSLVIENDTLSLNGSNAATVGGAIYMDYGSLSINFATLAYNKGVGAAIYIDGDADPANKSTLNVTNTIIYNLNSEFASPSITSQIYIPVAEQITTTGFSTANNIYSHYYIDRGTNPDPNPNALDLTNVDSNRLIGYDSKAAPGHEGDKSNLIQSNLYLDTNLLYAANYRTMCLAILSTNSWAYNATTAGGITHDQRGNSRTAGFNWTWDSANNLWTSSAKTNTAIGAFDPLFHTEITSNGDDSKLFYTADPNAQYFDTALTGGLTLREAIYWIDTRATLKTYTDPVNGGTPLAGEYDSRYVGFNSTYFAAPTGSVNPNNTIQLKYGQIEIGGRWSFANMDSSTSHRDIAVGYMIRNPDNSGNIIHHDNTLRAKDDPNRITVLSDGTNRLFMNSAGSVLALNNLTISGGVGVAILSEYSPSSNGGAIYNEGKLTLIDMVVQNSNNSEKGGNGGGIYNVDTAYIYDSSILNNTSLAVPTETGKSPATGRGGGIWNGGNMTIDRSQINGNTVSGSSEIGIAMIGGGIYNQGTLTIERSEITGNKASGSTIAKNAVKGAGIYNSGTLNIANSTIAENKLDTTGVKIDYAKGQTWGSYGSAIYNTGSIISYYNTIIKNTALVTDSSFWNPLTLKAVNLESMAAFYNADTAPLSLSNSILTENIVKLTATQTVWQKSDLYIRTATDVDTTGDNGKYNIIGAYNSPRVEQDYIYLDPSTQAKPNSNIPVYYELTYVGTTATYTGIYEYVAQPNGAAVNTGFDWANAALNNIVGFYNDVPATGAPSYVSTFVTTSDFLFLHPIVVNDPTGANTDPNAVTYTNLVAPFIYTDEIDAQGSPTGRFIKVTGFNATTGNATYVVFDPSVTGSKGNVGLYTLVGGAYFPYTIVEANAAYANDLYTTSTPAPLTAIFQDGHTAADPGVIPDTSNLRYGLVNNLNMDYTLNYNGALTRSYRILSGSVALDTGKVIADPGVFYHIDTDQRGADRGLLGSDTNRGSFDYLDTITVRSALDSSIPRVGFDFANYRPLWESSTLTLREAVLAADDGSHIVFKDYWQVNGSTYIDPANPNFTGAIDNIGGYAAGTTTINMDGFSGTITVGSYIKIAGDSNYHKVLSAVKNATFTTVTFDIPLVNAVLDNAAVTDYTGTIVSNEIDKTTGSLIINLVGGEILASRSITINGMYQWNLVDANGNIQSHHQGGVSQLTAGTNSRIFNLKSAVANTLSTVGISNFAMSGGKVTGNGGGIFSSANLWLDNVTIQNCKANAKSATSGDGLGGGIFSDQGYLQMVNSTISGNTASVGGGIYASGKNSPSSLVLDIGHMNVNGTDYYGGTSITGNTATHSTVGSGGGIYLLAGNANFMYSTVGNNKAVVDGGGIFVASTGALTMTNSTVANNTSGRHGGGIAFFSNNSISLNYVTVANNQAGWTILGAASGNPFATGGGIFMNSGSLNIYDSIIAQNFAGKLNNATQLIYIQGMSKPVNMNDPKLTPVDIAANLSTGIHDDLYVNPLSKVLNLMNSVYGSIGGTGTVAAPVLSNHVPDADWTNFSTTKLDSKLTDNGGRTKTVYVFNSPYFQKAVGGVNYDQTRLENFTNRITAGAYENSVDKVLFYVSGEITKGRDSGSTWVSANGVVLTEADGVLNASNAIFTIDNTTAGYVAPTLNYSWTIGGTDWANNYFSWIEVVNSGYLTIASNVAGTTNTSVALNGRIIVRNLGTVEFKTTSLATTQLSVDHVDFISDTTVIYSSTAAQKVFGKDAKTQLPMDYDNLVVSGSGTAAVTKSSDFQFNVYGDLSVDNMVTLNVTSGSGTGTGNLNVYGEFIHNSGIIQAGNTNVTGTATLAGFTTIDGGGTFTTMNLGSLLFTDVLINTQKTVTVSGDLTMTNVTVNPGALPATTTAMNVSGNVNLVGIVGLTNTTITAGAGKTATFGDGVTPTTVTMNGNVSIGSTGATAVFENTADIVANGTANQILANKLTVSNWAGGTVNVAAAGALKINVGAQNVTVTDNTTNNLPAAATPPLNLGLDRLTVGAGGRFELVTTGIMASTVTAPAANIDGTLALSGKINLDTTNPAATFLNIVKPTATLELGGTITIPGNFVTNNSLFLMGTAKVETKPTAVAVTIQSVNGSLSIGTAATFTGNSQNLTLMAGTSISLGNITGIKALNVTAGTDITLANSVTVGGDLSITAGGSISSNPVAPVRTLNATGNITFNGIASLNNITVTSAKTISFVGDMILTGNTTIGSSTGTVKLNNTNVIVTGLNNNIVTKALDISTWNAGDTIQVIDPLNGSLKLNIGMQNLAIVNGNGTSTASLLSLGVDRMTVNANNRLEIATSGATPITGASLAAANIHGTLALNGKVNLDQNFTLTVGSIGAYGTLEFDGEVTIKKDTGVPVTATIIMPNSIVFAGNVKVDAAVKGITSITSTAGNLAVGSNVTTGAKFTGNGNNLVLDAVGDVTLGNITGINKLTVVCGDTNQDLTPDDITKNIFLNNSITVTGTGAGTGDVIFKSLNPVQVQKAFTSTAMTTMAPIVITAGTTAGTITAPGFSSSLSGSSELQLSAGTTTANSSNIGAVNMSNSLTFLKGGFASGNITLTLNGSNLITKAALNVTGNIDIQGNGKLENSAALTVSGDIQLAGGATTSLLNNLATGTINTATIHLLDTTFAGTLNNVGGFNVTGAINNAGGYASGTKTINVNGFNGAIAVGSYITIAGDPNTYKVASTVGGATPTSITLSTGLANAVVDTAVITRVINTGVTTISVTGFTGPISVGSFITIAGDATNHRVMSIVGGNNPTSITLSEGLKSYVAVDALITVHAPASLTNAGTFTATGAVSLVGGNITNSKAFNALTVTNTFAGNLSNSNYGNITNSGTINVTGNITLVSTGNLTNSGTISSTTVHMIDGIINNSKILTVNDYISFTGTGSLTNTGTLTVTNDVTLSLSGAFNNNTGTAVLGGVLTLVDGSLTNKASLTVNGVNGIQITGKGSLTNSSTLKTDVIVMNDTALVNPKTGNFTNSGTVTDKGNFGGVANISLLNGGILTNTGANFNVNTLTLTGSAALNNNTGIITANTINLANGTLTNKATLAASTLTIGGTGNIVNSSILKEKTALTGINISLNGGGSLTNTGSMTTVNALVLKGDGTLNNNTGTLTANTLDMVDGTLTNKANLNVNDGLNGLKISGKGDLANSGALRANKITLANGNLTNSGTGTIAETTGFVGSTITLHTIDPLDPLKVKTLTNSGTSLIIDNLDLDGTNLSSSKTLTVGGTFTIRGAGTRNISLTGGTSVLSTVGTVDLQASTVLNQGKLTTTDFTFNGAMFFQMNNSTAGTSLEINGTLTGCDATHYFVTAGTSKVFVKATNATKSVYLTDDNLHSVIHIDVTSTTNVNKLVGLSTFVPITTNGQYNGIPVGPSNVVNAINRVWTITRATGDTSNLTVKFYWDTTVVPSEQGIGINPATPPKLFLSTGTTWSTGPTKGTGAGFDDLTSSFETSILTSTGSYSVSNYPMVSINDSSLQSSKFEELEEQFIDAILGNKEEIIVPQTEQLNEKAAMENMLAQMADRGSLMARNKLFKTDIDLGLEELLAV